MGDKQRRLKDKASRYYTDGRLKDALKLYVRVVEEDPTELQCQLKIGDIHRKLNNREAAVDAYLPVAEAYAADGLMLKAIAVCKMILAVDSDHAATQGLLQTLSAKRRGPTRRGKAKAPVTLKGMGIAPTAAAPTAQYQDYGMVDFEGGGPADDSHGGGMRTIDPNELGASGPAVITGRPLTPPSGQTPPPNLSWPAAGQTPAPNLSWPASTAQPGASASQGPDVVMGEKLEDSALDIVVDASLLDALPEADEAPAPAPAPAPEALADAAAREVEAAMASLGTDAFEPEAPATEAPTTEAPATEAPSVLELDLEDSDNDLQAAMQDAMAEAIADVQGAEADDDEPIELPTGDADVPIDSPIELTDVITSGDLAPVVELSRSSEDIDVEALKAAEPDLGDLSRTQIPLFSELPKNAFIELLVQMEMRELPAEQLIISEGEVGDSFFVLVSGSVRVQHRDDSGQDVVLAYLNEGAFFGEMALLQDGARTATVVTQAESQIFEISKEVLDRVVSHYPSVANVLRNFYRQRLLSTAMATHPLFRPFSPDERRTIMELFKSRSFKKGETLVEEGKKGSGLFLLLYGSLEVVKDRTGAVPKVLAELASGDLFGEMSLLTGNPTMATVRAISDCFILRLGKKKFDELIMTHPQILELVSVISDEREGLNALILAQGSGTGAVLV